jgi:CBS domain-containing protein
MFGPKFAGRHPGRARALHRHPIESERGIPVYDFLDYQVEDVMTTSPVTVAPSLSLAETQALFEKHDFNAMPVVEEDGELIGVITKLDLLRAFRFTEEEVFPPYDQIMQRPVAELMSREPATVTPRAPLTRVLEKLLSSRHKSFPVVDGRQLVGVVAREDVLRGLRRAVAGERPWTGKGDDPA